MSTFSSIKGLKCLTCGRDYPVAPMQEGCPDCIRAGRPAILDAVYRLGSEEAGEVKAAGRYWDYHALLPVRDAASVVTLGEGSTPLLALPQAAEETGAEQVWVKYEALNPTHSWKDRTNAVAVAMARQFGFSKVLCASTGNHGVSLAAYATRAGLRCLVLLPTAAPQAAAQELAFFGATRVAVKGDTLPLMHELIREHGWYVSQRNSPGTGGRPFGNPFGTDGYKTIAFEIYHQLGGRAPDMVFVPVGGGDGAWGIYKGFVELRELGLTARVPQIIACQSISGASLAHAWREKLPQIEPVATASTIAFSIVDRLAGDHALIAVRRSEGRGVAVEETELVAAEDLLCKSGICVEPSSAASLAGLRKHGRENAGIVGKSVVLIATGTGLRWPATFAGISSTPPQIEASISALRRVVEL
jgi:threonine synthase